MHHLLRLTCLGVGLAPFHEPARFARDFCAVDLEDDGRLELAVADPDRGRVLVVRPLTGEVVLELAGEPGYGSSVSPATPDTGADLVVGRTQGEFELVTLPLGTAAAVLDGDHGLAGGRRTLEPSACAAAPRLLSAHVAGNRGERQASFRLLAADDLGIVSAARLTIRTRATSCVPGDLSGDGEADFVVATLHLDPEDHSSRAVRLVAFCGAGGPPLYDRLLSSTPAAWAVGVKPVGDRDGDGIVDLALLAEGPQERTLLSVSGASGRRLAAIPIGRGLRLAGSIDLDQDGRPEPALGDTRFSTVSGTARNSPRIASPLTGETLLEIPSPRTIRESWALSDRFGHRIEGLGDLDGDGVEDLAVSANSGEEGSGTWISIHSGWSGTLLGELFERKYR